MGNKPIEKIISGGQTGADRAALDWAIENRIPHGGWCPKGRKAEDGRILEKYRLQETPSADYAERTELNVRDSDATVIFTETAELTGGSLLTARFAAKYRKAWVQVPRGGEGLRAFLDFLSFHKPMVLNVAGLRASQAPEIGHWVKTALDTAVSGK
jgi:hypothetical protein